MKKRILLMGAMLFALSCCGCSTSDSKSATTGSTTVDQVLAAQTESATEDSVVSQVTEETTEDSVVSQVTEDAIAAAEETGEAADVDIDFTTMSSDMVYATVYQMCLSPEEYVGQTVRMEGQYYASYYETTELYYHYCIVSDATACCAKGLEFVWGDGTHTYPDDYPENYTQVVVVGTFATYEELGIQYCHLVDATLTVE